MTLFAALHRTMFGESWHHSWTNSLVKIDNVSLSTGDCSAVKKLCRQIVLTGKKRLMC
jgi:hypothetical protein